MRITDERNRHYRALLILAIAGLVGVTSLISGRIQFVLQICAWECAGSELLDMVESLPGIVHQVRADTDGNSGVGFEFMSESNELTA